mgnify:FL=1
MQHPMKHGTAHDVAPAGMVNTAVSANKSEAYRDTKRMPRRMQGRSAKRSTGRGY